MFGIVSKKDLSRKLERLVVPAIVILVGLSAFALGRLSAEASQEPLTSAIVGQ